METLRSPLEDEVVSDLIAHLDGYIVAWIRERDPDAITWYADYDEYWADWLELFSLQDPELCKAQRDAVPLAQRLYVDSPEEREQATHGVTDKLRRLMRVHKISAEEVVAAMPTAREQLIADPPEGVAILLEEFTELVMAAPLPLSLSAKNDEVIYS